MGVQIGRDEDGRIVLELGPSFRAEDARRLHEVLECAAPGTDVDIDFHAVRECHPVALGLLARDLATSGARIALVGLRRHDQRLLDYLGAPSLALDAGHA